MKHNKTIRGLRLVGHGISTMCILVLLFTPASRYEWMEDLDPTIKVGSIQDNDTDKIIFTLLVAVSVVIVQMLMLYWSKSRLSQAVSLTLILVAVLIWIFRFSG